MQLNTKYDLGDRIWTIKKQGVKEWVRCTACPGYESPVSSFEKRTTVVLGNGEEYTCPECRGDGGAYVHMGLEWVPDRELTVGQVGVTLSEQNREERYMCKETGVGSGSVYFEEKIFPSLLLAQLACDVKNKVMAEDE